MTDLQILGTNEILCALLSHDVRGNVQHLSANPKDYIAETYGVELLFDDMNIVQNSAEEMHLSLPYYGGIERIHTDTMSEENMDDVSGGEWVVLGILLAVGVPAVVAAGVGGGVHAHFVRNPK